MFSNSTAGKKPSTFSCGKAINHQNFIPSLILESAGRRRWGHRRQTSSSNQKQCRRYAEVKWQSMERNNQTLKSLLLHSPNHKFDSISKVMVKNLLH